MPFATSYLIFGSISKSIPGLLMIASVWFLVKSYSKLWTWSFWQLGPHTVVLRPEYEFSVISMCLKACYRSGRVSEGISPDREGAVSYYGRNFCLKELITRDLKPILTGPSVDTAIMYLACPPILPSIFFSEKFDTGVGVGYPWEGCFWYITILAVRLPCPIRVLSLWLSSVHWGTILAVGAKDLGSTRRCI